MANRYAPMVNEPPGSSDDAEVLFRNLWTSSLAKKRQSRAA